MTKAKCKCGKSEITFKFLKEEDVTNFINPECCLAQESQPAEPELKEEPQAEAELSAEAAPAEAQPEQAPEAPAEEAASAPQAPKKRGGRKAAQQTIQE